MRYFIVFMAGISMLSSAVLSAPTVSYTALSDAAHKAGQLQRYDDAPVRKESVSIGEYKLDFSVPKKVRAYDVIPVRYTLNQPAGAREVAIEAVAFEDTKKAGKKPLYDMTIPGDLQVKIDFLGSVSADYLNDKYIPLTADPKSPTSPFPPIKRDPMVRSSTIREALAVWFKFRITNTGDTILDPDGFGASFVSPVITRIGKDGKPEWTAQPVNLYVRQLNYIYPGESVELWTGFWCPRLGSHNWGLTEGDYIVAFPMMYRYHREFNWWVNIWGGAEFARFEMPIKVTKEGGSTPVTSNMKITDTGEKMPGYLDTLEEFMTSFRIYKPVEKNTEQSGTIYLQVAPWTKHAVVKLILTDPKQIAIAKIPIQVSDETLDIRYNPDNVMVIDNNGREEPVFVAQAMPGMRTGFQLGPYAEDHLLKEIREMKALGVNLIANTSGGWWLSELTGRKSVELCSAQYKYWYDVLARKEGMKLQGWSVYPPSGESWFRIAEVLLGKKVEYSKVSAVYGFTDGVDQGDPVVPEVIAAWVKYNYGRWGDMWFKTRDGKVPIDIEDSWGWMRDDINCRYFVGSLALQRFRVWVQAKYTTIDNVNKAWNSSYKGFDEIDPQADQGIEGDGINYGPTVFNKKENVFHDWSPAIEDWDTFRTELRIDILRKALRIIRRTIPGAVWSIRSEGSNLIMKGDPKSDNMHWRHVYYSQRRNAAIFDIVKNLKVVGFYSDYTTLPHSEYEWRQAMREMVDAGIIPGFLPQFDHMRDILLNPHYGRDYQMKYNLDKPTKGMMIHCLVAAYPWWKATYEEGGASGIIWSDYLCDGFATETQKRELKLLTEYFRKMRK
ncbi:MAG: beta-galactosidase [Armatimonadota bacterium]